MTSSQEVDDELARRFRQVFNKDPVSQVQEESKWKIHGDNDFDVDDEEVWSMIRSRELMVVGQVD
jgi:predicted nuclease of predicted toxin-antitoxin system